MGANSVTGTGLGCAGNTRGPGNNRNQFYSNVDPHVVWHGTATLDNNAGTVYLPSTIRVPPEQLAVIICGKGWVTGKVTDADGYMTAFTLVGYGTVIDYLVVDANSNCFCDNYA